MARRATVCRENSLSTVDVLRSEIRDKFKYLHIALDERESELMYRLDEVTGIIANALKQWNSSINNVEHTISHANSDIRDNKWGSKLLKEAREELDILEKSKPSFEVDFKLNDGIKEVIANLGEVNIKQTNKQTEIYSKYKPDRNIKMGWATTYQSSTLQNQFKDRLNIKKIESETNVPIVPIEKVSFLKSAKTYKLPRSNSCGDLIVKQNKNEILNNKYPNRSFDDSCITKGMKIQKLEITTEIVKPKGFVWIRGSRNDPNRNVNKPQNYKREKISLFKKEKEKSIHIPCATYKLSELRIQNYLADRVTVTSRKNKEKQINGTLRCVVNEGVKIPIVGIELDTKDGESDGKFGDIRYFKTKPNKAYFLTADKVRIIL